MEIRINDTVDAKVISKQGYGIILEYDGHQIIVLAPYLPQKGRETVSSIREGSVLPVNIVRKNEQTGAFVGRIEARACDET
jgi:hypothetical protein